MCLIEGLVVWLCNYFNVMLVGGYCLVGVWFVELGWLMLVLDVVM